MRPDYRLFACVRCRRLVAICSVCDRGQWYCGRMCSQQSRREKMRAAGRRYQATRRGRHRHATRQARYRHRRRDAQHGVAAEKVTHQATPGNWSTVTLRATTTVPGPLARCSASEVWRERRSAVICDFCGALCAPYARFEPLRRRRRAGVDIAPNRSA